MTDENQGVQSPSVENLVKEEVAIAATIFKEISTAFEVGDCKKEVKLLVIQNALWGIQKIRYPWKSGAGGKSTQGRWVGKDLYSCLLEETNPEKWMSAGQIKRALGITDWKSKEAHDIDIEIAVLEHEGKVILRTEKRAGKDGKEYDTTVYRALSKEEIEQVNVLK